MLLFKRTVHIEDHIKKNPGATIAFVPTMGALHEGHLSLIRAAKEVSDLVVVSIFVNPTQFNDPSDFEKYPVTTGRDVHLLSQSPCDILFLPDVPQIYPQGPSAPHTRYELGSLDTVLEGRFRPGHFQGVCRVMDRLLHIVNPHWVLMGQKDYQQCMVVARLLQLLGLRTRLQVCPTLREPEGLAMSSRNLRLTDTERKKANVIYRALKSIDEQLSPGEITHLIADASRLIEEAGLRPDYLVVADADDLQEVMHWDGKQRLVALAAAFMHEVRLIDNLVLHEAR